MKKNMEGSKAYSDEYISYVEAFGYEWCQYCGTFFVPKDNKCTCGTPVGYQVTEENWPVF